MATLKITRSNERTNRLRDIKIFLDEVQLGKIGNAETQDFKVVAGSHVIQAKIDWGLSNKVTCSISENGVIHFNLDSFANHNPMGSFAAIYYITFGADKYLHLQEVSQ